MPMFIDETFQTIVQMNPDGPAYAGFFTRDNYARLYLHVGDQEVPEHERR